MKGRIAEINYEKAVEFLKIGDVNSTLKHAERAQEFGHPRAPLLLQLARHLQVVEGLLKRSEGGDGEAMYQLGLLYLCGVGTGERKLEEGIEYMQRAWDTTRHELAGRVLTCWGEEGPQGERICAVLRVMADSGSAEAQLELAHWYMTGGDGTLESNESNFLSGVQYLKLSVDQQYPPAIEALAELRASLPATGEDETKEPKKT